MANKNILQIKRKNSYGEVETYDIKVKSDNVDVIDPFTGTTETTTLTSAFSNLKQNVTNMVTGTSNVASVLPVFDTNVSSGVVKRDPTTTASPTKFLNEQGKFITLPTATTSAAGNMPALTTAQNPNTYYLNGQGEWSIPPVGESYSTFTTNTNGLVPKPASSIDASYYLNGIGGWTRPINTTYDFFIGASSSSNGVEGLVPSIESTSMTSSNTLPGSSNTSRYFLNASGWQAIPSATASREGLMTTAQVADLNSLKVASSRFRTSVEKYENIATITFNGTNPPNAEDAEWVPARFVHGMGLIIEAPVPGYTTIESYTLTDAFIFGKTGGWQGITDSFIKAEIKQGILRIIFNKIGSTYGYELGENATASLNATFQLS